jgi:hypothetical protein
VWWERELTMEPVNKDDAHRPLDKSHSLAASLSHVEMRQVRNDYTLRFEGQLYQIERSSIVKGLRNGDVRMEKRLDGSLAVRFGERYLPIAACAVADKAKVVPAKPPEKARRAARPRSDWGKNFDLKKAPKIWQVAHASSKYGEAHE